MKLRLRKLEQKGFDHILLGLAFVVIIAIGGSYYLIKNSNANAWSGALKLNNSSNLCMENMNNSTTALTTVRAITCNNKSQAQKFTRKDVPGSSTNFQLVAAASGACVDDTAGKVQTKTGVANRVYVETYKCNSSDTAQVWHWGGTGNHQLINVRSGGCINYPTTSNSIGRLIVYSCAKSLGGDGTNAQWIEVGNSASTGSGGSTGTPVPLPPNGAQGQLKVNGNAACLQYASGKVTLAKCAAASNQSQQWYVSYSDQTDGNPVSITTTSGAALCVNGNGSANGQAIIVSANGSSCGSGTNFWGYRGGMLETNGSNDEKTPLSSNFCMADLNGGNTTVQVSPCSGKSQQTWTLPANPNAGSGGNDGGSGNNGGGNTGGSGNSGGSGGGSSDGSGVDTADLTTVLTQLQQVDPSFDCNTLTSSTAVQICDGIFGQS